MLSSQHLPPIPDRDGMDAKPMSLPSWIADPVAKPYMGTKPLHLVHLTNHPAFASVGLYLHPEEEGGAIIHQTTHGTVLALDYSDAAVLSDEWCGTLRHYAKWCAAAKLVQQDCA